MNNKGEPNIYITDIFWDRVFLNIIIKASDLIEEKIYFSSKNHVCKAELDKIEDNKYQARINITNIQNGEMLQNSNYTIKVKNKDDKYEILPINYDLGYKLEKLDKVYRYYKECYAYTINFEVQQLENEEITCVLKSRYMKVNKKPKNYCTITPQNTIKSFIKTNIKNLLEVFLNILYKCFSIINFNKKNSILLMSETRSPISGNLKALDERLKERKIDKKYQISYSFSKTLEERYLKVIIKWIKLIWTISKQSFIFIDDYSPLFKFINLDKKTKLIQVWHAGVGFKSVGYARFGFGGPEPYNSCHRKYDYAIVGAKALIPVYEEVFGIEKEKILPYGLPRLDNYLKEDHINEIKERVYHQYSELKDKKIILFAPTFRGRGQKTAYYPYEKIDLDSIFNLCNEKGYIFLIKMHPFIKKKINIPEEYKTQIKDFSDYAEINDLLYITDILITDYSSNIYDFSLLNKPVILYAFDLDEYQLINKIQRPIREHAPGKVCDNFEEVISAIQNEDFELEKLKRYREENFDNIDCNSSDLIIDNIILRGEDDVKKNINNMC